jgi:hypothetical protein
MENGTAAAAVHTDITIEDICGELEKYWERNDKPKPGEFMVKNIQPIMKGSRETVRSRLEKLVKDGVLIKRENGHKVFYKFVNDIK